MVAVEESDAAGLCNQRKYGHAGDCMVDLPAECPINIKLVQAFIPCIFYCC